MKRNVLYILVCAAVVFALNGCGGARSGGGSSLAPDQVKALSDFSDHAFDARAYIVGMGGENRVYVWQDPAANLGGYHNATMGRFSGRLLPSQDKFSYEPYIKSFEGSVRDSLDIKAGGTLRIEGSLVECNPGSRAARYLVGMGAGKAAVAGVIEVFEPGKKRPSLRLYARDTASAGGFGGDSVGMMNHIINVLAVRMTSILEGRIDIR
ncbi:MAG: DUF4410 domain-containing protein [Proteobacteria bacterium]|nr:DUF4410 domain-containing protein [Pseudomonadota bacterium]MBU1639518.1 DUF4410 domain-containing protein [Pseudomonadota bacterium]